jgi:hypothetical protein
MTDELEPGVETIAETENYQVWVAEEPDEVTYHLELGNFTIHFFQEEWDGFMDQLDELVKEKVSDDTNYELKFFNGVIQLSSEEMTEFQELGQQLLEQDQ